MAKLSNCFIYVTIDEAESLLLAPLSVVLEYQNMGIGIKLILEDHRMTEELGYKSVIVLGNSKYYCRFGYRAVSNWDIKELFDASDEYFMDLELIKDGLT